MFKQIFNNHFWLAALILLVTWFLINEKRYKWAYIIYKTWKRDTRGLVIGIKAISKILTTEWNQDTIPKLFTKTLKRHPDKVAFYFEDEVWTFQQVEEYSNKIANYFIAIGYKKGDTVALLLENRPEFVAIWMGLAKIGVSAALINTNLVSKSLLHCISAVNARGLIFGSDYTNAVKDILANLGNIKMFKFNTSLPTNQQRVISAADFKKCIAEQPVTLAAKYLEGSKITDTLLYIFTSGTTGLPKPARITHSRFTYLACGLYCALELTDDDIFYNPLPLYHASGGMLTMGLSLIFGVRLALRSKFSASNFWNDCIKYKCTASNYIGETCRYILAAHKGQNNIKHGVKKMYGNGLKKEVWKEFVETFNNPQMFEGYGSTEGNVNILNIDGTIGAVGFVPVILSIVSPLILIKCNEETNEPIRDANGYCIRCKDGEPGLLLGKIYKQLATCRFEGYADDKDTKKKVLRDVFKKGDAFFNTGDLMVKDELNYYYFKDRMGDTYRWKGENVATTEVEFIASEILGPKNIVVYGVEVPNNEGRAGMIGIVDKENAINTKALAEGFKSNLPPYAVPLFLRHLDSMPLTSTFKVKKNELQKEGFDINVVKDPLYIFDNTKGDYLPLKDVYEDVVSGKRKL